MKEKLRNILYWLVYAIAVVYFIGSGVYDICGFNTYYKATIVAADKIIETEHSVWGLIPLGTDYYYEALTGDGDLLIVRASQNWQEENFNSDCTAKNKGGLEIKGTTKSLSYDEKNAISESMSEYEGINMPLGDSQSIDVLYYDVAVKSIIAGGLLIVAGIVGVLVCKNKKLHDLVLGNTPCIIILAAGAIAVLVYCGFVAVLK